MSDTDVCLQGIATLFDQPILHGDTIIALASGCFDKALKTTDVALLCNHDESKVYGSTKNRLQIHAGGKSLAFRFIFPSGYAGTLTEIADDPNSYKGVSVGYKIVESEIIKIDGFDVKLVREAELKEISVLSGTPAVDGTYVHVLTRDSCADLEHEHTAGLLEVRGMRIRLHRKLTALDTGELKYSHISTLYDLAASKFQRALARLA